ncbi:hypothetical protein DPMN_106208 [Dreissena polymorpha]|uniref:G-protein coupled receptors family 1 profile domain-containing protein n=1 Tax=Dreissena polymorpha TaxID=45954 RepID=A0A9D4K4J3_DREPO|nr:hypothetical protein DPMN_106208 [Dreissena polymorpha]
MENRTAEKLNEDMLPKIIWVLVFTGLEIIVGLIGNVLVILVFAFRYHKCSFRYFVICVAFLDLLSVLTTLPGEMITQIYWYVFPPIETFCKFKSFCNIFTVCGEAFCLLIIAVDRYRKVCRPHGWQIHARNALLSCLGTILISGLISIPGSMVGGIRTYQDNELNVSITACEKDEDYVDNGVHKRYVLTIGAMLVVVLVATIGLYVPITSVLLQQRPPKIRTLKKNDTKSSEAESSSSYISHKNLPKIDHRITSSVTMAEICPHPDDSSVCHATDTDICENVLSQSSGSTRESSEDTIDTDGKTTAESWKTKVTKQKRNTKEMKQTKRLQATKGPIVLSIIFTVTVVLYLALLAVQSHNKRFLRDMSDDARAAYFFGLRVFFINHVINPFVYFVLDREFKQIVKRMSTRCFVNIMTILPNVKGSK